MAQLGSLQSPPHISGELSYFGGQSWIRLGSSRAALFVLDTPRPAGASSLGKTVGTRVKGAVHRDSRVEGGQVQLGHEPGTSICSQEPAVCAQATRRVTALRLSVDEKAAPAHFPAN